MKTRRWKILLFAAAALSLQPALLDARDIDRQAAPAGGKKPRIVGVEIKMTDKEIIKDAKGVVTEKVREIKQVPIPHDIIEENGELHLGIENARAAIRSLKDGDVLVFGVHSSPKGFRDGDKFIPWKDFWTYFLPPGQKPPKLSNIIVCGCMVHYFKIEELKDNIDPGEIEPLRRFLNTESIFLPVEFYDFGHMPVVRNLIRGILDGIPLKDLEDRTKDEKNQKRFHFVNGPIKPRFEHAAGGVVGVQQKKQSWYCTNRPNIGVQCSPAPQVRKGDPLKPGLGPAQKSAGDLLNQLKDLNIDPAPYKAFQDALLLSVRNIKSPGELPFFLRPAGMPIPSPNDAEAFGKWKEAAEATAAAWWLRVLSLGLSNRGSGAETVRSSLKNSLNGRLNELKPLGDAPLGAIRAIGGPGR
jgi:hypothetical protein